MSASGERPVHGGQRRRVTMLLLVVAGMIVGGGGTVAGMTLMRWLPKRPHTVSGLIRAARNGERITLSERDFEMLKEDIGRCQDVRELNMCVRAILGEGRALVERSPRGTDRETRSRIEEVWEYCVQRLVDIGSDEAARALVLLLWETDAGGTLTVGDAIYGIGRPALPFLRVYDDKAGTASELREAIETGRGWGP